MDRGQQKSRTGAGRCFFILAGIVALIAGVSFYIHCVLVKIPDEIYVRHTETTTVSLNIPVTGEKVLTHTASAENTGYHGADANAGQVVDFNRPVTFVGGSVGEYKMRLKLFGLFEIRTVSVNVVHERYVYPCGFQIGMYLKTDGVLAVSIGELQDADGNIVRPCENIIFQGDYIVAVNGEKLDAKSKLMQKVKDSGGEPMVLTVRRNGSDIDVCVVPAADADGEYKIGLWVKDDAQGIGTVTFIDSQDRFGALGHGISDSQTASLLTVKSGALYNTRIISIVKGSNGEPGEFIGTIDYSLENRLGAIGQNTNCGIFGKLDTDLIRKYGLSEMLVGYSHEVHTGEACIRMYDGREYKDYAVEITDTSVNDNKNITFKVVSEALLEKTNGIVQGMSGCPIIQDGKIVGAVTHVFVEDCRSGYGVFIEKMLNKLPD